MTEECELCGAPADRDFGDGRVCEDCYATVADTPSNEEATGSGDIDLDFTDIETGVWPTELLEREQWMAHVGKQPFAPWADRDHPSADADEDARWKWGIEDNYVDGHTVALAEDDPRVDGRAFLQQFDDPYAYVDGDDVRDPETGEVHPGFKKVISALGVSYTDVSQSGAGIHILYRGELPDGVKQATWRLQDEPWGANEDPPSVEIYAGKRVCVATGDHVAGSPTEIRSWDEAGLEELLEEYDELPEEPPDADDRDELELEDYEPTATEAEETTDDWRDIIAAVDRLDARRVAERTIVHDWNEGASTSKGKRAFYPTWGPNSNGTANIVDEEIWQDTGDLGGYGGPVVMALIDMGEVSPQNATPRVRGDTWKKGVEHLRELGFPIPRYDPVGDTYHRGPPDPTAVDVTIEPRTAWRAAAAVGVEDLETPVDVETQDTVWICPECGDPIDVVRAVGISEGFVSHCGEDLADDYARAYAIAREDHGAPLPEYLTRSDAVMEADKAIGAADALDFWHLDSEALVSEISARGDELSGEAVLALDPTPVDGWRDSESGESVLVFESGTVWDAETEETIDPLRLVALETGIIDSPGDTLAGGDFVEAYQVAREQYGAPLPRWRSGPGEITAMLPPAEELVEDPAVDQSDITAARQDVERLYRKLVARGREDTEAVQILTALPATGKTTAALKTAKDEPTAYFAGRKDLMKQAEEKAENWGVGSWMHLPILSEKTVPDDVLETAKQYVRENGREVLETPWVLEQVVSGPILVEPGHDDDDPPVELDRVTCETAEGEHGDAWALAIHVARELDHTPRDIHERPEAIFGGPIPCQQDENDCECECRYSMAWDRVADPQRPLDLVIGHYTHANVESARTYHKYEDNRGHQRVRRSPRALVFDEFVGLQFAEEFGEEFREHTTWIAGALVDDIQSWQDLIDRRADLWDDEWVRAWLAGDDAHEYNDAVETLDQHLLGRIQLLEAVDTVVWALENAANDLADLGLKQAFERVVQNHTDTETAVRDLASEIDQVWQQTPETANEFHFVSMLLQGITRPLAPIPDIDLDDTPLTGELRGLVERAITAGENIEDGAKGMLRSARAALRGGDDGTRELSLWADDGWAHRDAHRLLRAYITPTDHDDSRVIETSQFDYGADSDGTQLHRVATRINSGSATAHGRPVIVDRNHRGATVLKPPGATAANGGTCPTIGLDATGRASLWALAMDRNAELKDIHSTPRERAEFLRDVLGLQVVQMSDRMHFYEGDPDTKDLDKPVALLEHVHEQFSGAVAPRDRNGSVIDLGRPAAVTTKVVREVLENDDRLANTVAEWENYGNLKGANDMGGHRLAALLGCQHFGDQEIEHFSALAGQEADTDRSAGRGPSLDYDAPIANDYLKHMSHDQVMQAALRFARGDSGAVVFTFSSALRDDLPLIGRGQIAKTWSETATSLVRRWKELGDEFTVADVVDAVDRHRNTVRRTLRELANAGYLEIEDPGDGLANTYRPTGAPGAGEISIEADVDPASLGGPPQNNSNTFYTWSVGVAPLNDLLERRERPLTPGVPAPNTEEQALASVEPPGSPG